MNTFFGFLLFGGVLALALFFALRKKPSHSERVLENQTEVPEKPKVAIPKFVEFVPGVAKTKMGREGELTSRIAFLALEEPEKDHSPTALLALCREKAQQLREEITEVKSHKILLTIQIFSETWDKKPSGERLFTYHWKGWESAPEEVSWPGRPPAPPDAP